MPWIPFLLYSAFIFYLIFKLKFFQLEGLKRGTPLFFFLLKIIASVALWGVYTFYYTDKSNSDIWKYFDDSKVMTDAFHDHPADYFKMLSGIGDDDSRIDMTYYHKMNYWYQQFDNNLLNDAHIIIRFNAFVRLFSFGNYFTHALLMCFLAFTGLCAIYKIFFPVVKEWKVAAAALFFLLPSLTFWSSGVMKEGLMLLGLGVVIYNSFCFFTDRKWYRIIYILLASWLLFFTKLYVLAALIPSSIGAFWVMKNSKAAVLKFLVVLVLCFAAGMSIKFFKPKDDPLQLLALKQIDFIKQSSGGTYLYSDSVVAFIASDKRADLVKINGTFFHIRKGADYYYWKIYPDFKDTLYANNNHDTTKYKILNDFPRAGSLMESEYLQPTVKSFLMQSPRALFRALFRPLPWELKNPMNLLPAFENVILILLLFLVLFFRGKISSPAIFGFCLTFSLLLLLVMGLITPVLGALVRYRIAAQPFLFLALLMCIDREKLMKRWKWLEKFGI